MHQTILANSNLGNFILADHVLVEPGWVAECAALFSEKPAWLIGVRCPLEVVEERERNRKDRTLGQARSQYECVHRHGLYDIEVDTSLMNPSECADKIKNEIFRQGTPSALKKLKERSFTN
jgi:chloramphenicol 3-O phosphotransferase